MRAHPELQVGLLMSAGQIAVEAWVDASIDRAWETYTSPEHVTHWNFASDDWHCPSARADFRDGGTFSSRMEAKDGSFGFDFEGVYTKIVKGRRIEYAFGDRRATVEFLPNGDRIMIRVSFDPETTHSLDQQRAGWQSILDNYAKYTSRG
jgi:uncharacterized protein YndB with AHSA1/START domain